MPYVVTFLFCRGEGVGKGLVLFSPLSETCQNNFDSPRWSKFQNCGSPEVRLEEDRGNSEKPVVGAAKMLHCPGCGFCVLALGSAWEQHHCLQGLERLVQTLVLAYWKASCHTQHHHFNLLIVIWFHILEFALAGLALTNLFIPRVSHFFCWGGTWESWDAHLAQAIFGYTVSRELEIAIP